MSKYGELQAVHQHLLEQSEETEDPKEMLEDVLAYIEQIKADAEFVSNPRERNQLRANLRYWASFVYDQTGNYPNTNMRPASLPPTSPERVQPFPKPGRRTFFAAVSIVSGILIIFIFTFWLNAQILLPTSGIPQSTSTAVMMNTLESGLGAIATQTAIAGGGSQADKTQLPSAETTATTSASPFPTIVIPQITDLIASPTIDRTATVSALLTEVVAATEVFTPSTPPPLLPDTGGGELFLNANLVSSGIPAEECGLRTLTITINPIELFSDLDLVAQVELSQGGEVVAMDQLPFQSGTVTFTLPDNKTDAALMVQVDQPPFLFETVIAQFYADCSRNQLTLNYQAEFVEELPPDLNEELIRKPPPDLQLSWRIVTWGPAPDRMSWIANLLLDAFGGDGNYIYWASGDVANSQENGLLLDNRLMVSKEYCDPAYLSLGVTSAGRTTQRVMVLQAPDCIEVTATPTP